jgi:iron complex transport system substrate-binding protein
MNTPVVFDFETGRVPLGAFLAGLLTAFLTMTAAPDPALSDPIEVVDAENRAVIVNDTSRVVSIGGSVTEILYALGLENRVAAVDTTSLYPARVLADKPNVGYMRALSPEGLLSTQPSLILAEEGSGPPEALELLKSASVPFLLVPSRTDATGVVDKIRFIAKAMGVKDRGKLMADAVVADLAKVEDAAAAIDDPAKVLFILSLSNGRIMAAGEGTSAAAMIEMAGARNALTGFTGYKPVNAEAVLEAAPDVVVMMARGDHATSAEEVFAHPALARTPAAANNRLITMDGLYLLGFGPRVAQAVAALTAQIYPDAQQAQLPGRPWAIDTPVSD